MRTNIEIDDNIMQAAMRGSEFKTKREAVEAGLKLLARQAHYREVLKWEGKLHWDDQPDSSSASSSRVSEQVLPYSASILVSKLPVQRKAAARPKRKAAGAA